MKNKILSTIGIFIILGISVSAQVSKQISFHHGTHNSETIKMFNSANWGMQTNRLEDAKQMFLKVVEIDSTFCDAWDNLSVCCRKLGQYDEAFYASMHSITINSINATAWINCGYSAFLGGNIEISLKSFDNLQQIIPGNPEGYYGKSFVLYAIDSIASAKENIRKS